MKRLLILCDMFPPAFAPRMGYLCKYLSRAGWEVDVVTERIPDQTFSFLEGYATRVHTVDFYTAKRPWLRKAQWLATMLLDLLFHYKDRKMRQVATDVIHKYSCQAVLGCTYRTFPLPAAAAVAKHFGLPFIADLRDIVEQYAGEEFIAHPLPLPRWLKQPLHRFFKQRLLTDRNRALQQATAVTTVSPWHTQTLSAFNPNTHLIYNGFDPELFYPDPQPNKCFTITYTGRLHSVALQDPTLLFEALQTLDQAKQIDAKRFQVVWYTDAHSRTIIEQEAARWQVGNYMAYHDYVPATAIPQVLNQSAILLVLTNKAGQGGPQGILTTKFFEYLSVEKPILCVRSDEGNLAAVIQSSQAGIAATESQEVCHFLLRHYQQWQQQGYTKASANQEILKQFSRKEQANQFARLIENYTHHE